MRRLFVPFAIAALLTLGHESARADGGLFHSRKPFSSDPNCPNCGVPQALPVAPVVPANPTPTPTPMPEPKGTAEPPVSPSPLGLQTPDAAPSFSPLVSAALGDSSFAVTAPGYIDSALPQNQIRLRFDSLYNMNRPDRAEYFYPKCGCFGGFSPGPPLPEKKIVSDQETSLYMEAKANNRLSGFIDVPFRAINPEVNNDSSGFGDLRYGFKYAFVYTEDQVVTFQLRGFIPTGDPRRGLGTNHNTLEPSLLYLAQMTEKVTFFAQLTDWIPISGTDFAGNVFSYGAGVGYTISENNGFKITPLAEVLGWWVLGGRELDLNANPPIASAAGDAIVNAKLGVRAGGPRQDFYIGYGRALTGERWYQDIFRVEFRLKF